MKKALVIIVIAFLLVASLSGCAATSGTHRGAAIGSVVGLVAGILVSNERGGALIGAAAGALIGAIIGNYHDKKIASRSKALKNHSYSKDEDILSIEASDVVPNYTTPGNTIEATVQYTVLSKNSSKRVKVTEIRTISLGDKKIRLAERDVMRAQGTYISKVWITLPRGLDRGEYTLVTTIISGSQSKTVTDTLNVT